MESESIAGTNIGWGVFVALAIGYFAAVLGNYWREQEKRKTRDRE